MRKPNWLRSFDLDDRPFAKDLADSDLWLPSSRKHIVDELVEAMHEHHHAVLVGDPGVGKTCTLRALRAQLPEAGFRLTYCCNATLGRRDFYRQLCLALGIPSKATAAAVFHTLSTHVEELARERVHPLFLLDEAHLLLDPVLSHLHILTNYEWDQKPLLSLILVGLPELWQRLERRIHRSLWSRIDCRLVITSARPEDTNEYIEYRLKRVGGRASVFASDALGLLHEATLGELRNIDRVATDCLRTTSRRKLKRVDREVVKDVIEADSKIDLS